MQSWGADVIQELLEHVNDGITNNLIESFCADITRKETLPERQWQIVTMQGVLSIFDNWELPA